MTDTKTEPEAEVTPQKVDVSAVLANVIAAEALRDRIADLKKQYEIHADMIRDALGAATEGTDSTGNVVVSYPWRSRHGLDKEAVKAILTDEQFGEVSKVTNYRVLLFGDGA
jgi:hypothetical protein